jgi:long-chain acyl-CoA synthetase
MNIFQAITDPAVAQHLALTAGTTEVTYGELAFRLASRAGGFHDAGVRPGDRVLLRGDSGLSFVEEHLALLSLGAWVIPVSSSVTPQERDEILRLAGGYDCPPAASTGLGQPTLPIPDAHECGVLHLSSGTTGTTKLCRRTLAACTFEGLAYRTVLGISKADGIVSGPPLTHSYAFGGALMAALASSASLHLTGDFVPRRVLTTASDRRATVLLLVPVMARLLLATRGDFDLTALRYLLVGAGAVPQDMSDAFRSRFGLGLAGNYGSSETGGLCCRLETGDTASVGRPMPGVDLSLRVDGHEANTGEIGEVWVRSNQIMSSYLGQLETATDTDGFFPMHDLATRDEAGNVSIVARTKSLIKVGGRAVNPAEIERVLSSHPGVRDCLVVGYAKDNGDQGVRALLVSDETLDTDELRRLCARHLSHYKVPQRVEQVSRIERNALGKPLQAGQADGGHP